MAPLMAGVAEVESGGNPAAENPSGATGLWQIEWPLYQGLVPGATSRAAYLDPATNAAAAVKLSQNNPSTAPGSPVYGNWLQWETPPGTSAIQQGVAPSLPGGYTGSLPAQTTSALGGLEQLGIDAADPGKILQGLFGGPGQALSAAEKAVVMFGLLFTPEPWVRLVEIVAGGALALLALGGIGAVLAGKDAPAAGAAVATVPGLEAVGAAIGITGAASSRRRRSSPGRAEGARQVRGATQRRQARQATRARAAEREQDRAARVEWQQIFTAADERGAQNRAHAPRSRLGGRTVVGHSRDVNTHARGPRRRPEARSSAEEEF